ncbi:ATP-grasp domain-containing protein [Streptomyces sp. NPDC046939]|uniref:carboxylate--amine ligase n=1 Tax=Streptomyces sp. NPDC046939 TaxID=3155376 RepID=UPI0033E6F4ED
MTATPAPPALDRDVPGLIVKFGAYPLHHGGVGAIRSLGRLGVPVYAITEDRWTPAAMSRYLCRAFPWRTTGTEEPRYLVDGLLRIARRVGRPTVLIPTDEEAAVLVAEHQEPLADAGYLLPRVERTLPRRLASKQGLYELCAEHGVPTAETVFPRSRAEIEEFAGRPACFPVVVKNREAFTRRGAPAVSGTTVVRTPAGLRQLARGWPEPPAVVLQEYVPREHAEDWIVHAYVGPDATPRTLFTGVKIRSWPPYAGMTAYAYVAENPELADAVAHFVKQLGYTGIIDLDLRLDRRDGQYKLLDFNPRVGAQFRLFEDDAGVDVVRALHLSLTGRDVPAGTRRAGRRYVVENIDLPARLAYRRKADTRTAPARAHGTERAWWAADDPLPFLTMLARSAGPAPGHLHRLWRTHRLARRPTGRAG